MRAVLAQFLAFAAVCGLFVLTCPLTVQSANPPQAQQPECCSMAADLEHCPAPGTDEEQEPLRCCVSDNCGSVIAAAPARIETARGGSPQLLLSEARSVAHRDDRPPVPPPRAALS